MKKKFLVKSVVCLLLFTALGASVVVYANITTRQSPIRTFVADGRSYQIQAFIDCFGSGNALIGTTAIWTTNGAQVPANTMRAQTFIVDWHGIPRATSASFWNSVPSSGMNVSTDVINPISPISGAFHAFGDVLVRNSNGSTTAQVTHGTPSILRNNIAEHNIAAFIKSIDYAYKNNEMVSIVGINDISGFAFAKEIRNATVGYINVYAGYCLTVVDKFPIVPSTVTYIN